MERQVCDTCPAKTWDPEKSTYFCRPEVFTVDKYHPNGGRRLRPTNCPENITSNSDRAQRILRGLLKR